jgi:hypothetical protein
MLRKGEKIVLSTLFTELENCVHSATSEFMGEMFQTAQLKEVAFIAGKSETNQPKKNLFVFSLII